MQTEVHNSFHPPLVVSEYKAETSKYQWFIEFKLRKDSYGYLI